MTKRIFELPGIQDLSKEQESARALPKNGRHLVVGGPGTGKSVLALLRARRHANAKEPHVFLVFNKLLHEASRCLGGDKIHCQQWMAWFFNIFRRMTGQNVPKLPPDMDTGWRDIDWENVHNILRQQPEDDQTRPGYIIPEYIIIDEGQDMPPDFYHALAGLGFENFFVVADQNQQIISGKNSSIRDIQLSLAIEQDKVVELTKNYRNTAAVARLANEFFTGDSASPALEVPENMDSKSNIPILFTYHPRQFDHMTARILKLADREPSKLIGVIAPNNNVRNEFFTALQRSVSVVRLDNAPPYIRTYHKNCGKPVNFQESGIIVLNAQACKGLEFDHVFLADIDAHYLNANDPDILKRLFYVMAARTKENLFLLKSANQPCPADKILPENQNILKQHP